MPYHQITEGERYAVHALWMQGLCAAKIARATKRHRGTIAREFQRNSKPCNGSYQPFSTHTYAAAWRSRSRRITQFTAADWGMVDALLGLD